MKRIWMFFLVGVLCLGISQVAGAEKAEKWERVKLVDNMDISIELPKGIEQQIWERESNQSFKSEFQTKDKQIMIRVTSTSDIGRIDKDEPSRYLFDRWTDNERTFFLETQKPAKYYLSDLNFEKQGNGHFAMGGVLKNMVGTEITIMHQGQLVTIQILVSGMIGQPVVDLLDRLQGSLIF